VKVKSASATEVIMNWLFKHKLWRINQFLEKSMKLSEQISILHREIWLQGLTRNWISVFVYREL